MKTTTLFAILAFTTLTASARTFKGLSRRTSSDTCANLVNLPVAVTVAAGIPPVTIGLINTCLCLSGISNFESTNIVAIAAVEVAGAPATTSSLTTLVHGHGSSCEYPDNAAPVCLASNVCSFTCNNGYTVDSGNCVCEAPNTVCNGICGDPSLCSTPQPPSSPISDPVKRHAIQKRSAYCGFGMTACGLDQWSALSSKHPWDCIDTRNDLESCGGCLIPLHDNSPRGMDCTAIPGVADVACASGSCVVHRCLAGHVLTSDKKGCFRKSLLNASPEQIQAAAFGLEHVSL